MGWPLTIVFLLASARWVVLSAQALPSTDSPLKAPRVGPSSQSKSPTTGKRRTPPVAANTASFEQLKAKAATARDADQNQEAIRLYQKLVELKPSWAEGWWYLGTLYYDSDQHAAAISPFHRVLALEPKNAEGYAMLGLCEYRLKQYISSLQHLAKARSLGLGGNQELARVVRYHESVLLTLGRQFEAALDLLNGFGVEHRESQAVLDALGLAVLRIPKPVESLPSDEREMVRQFGKAAFLFAERKMPESRALYDELEVRYRGRSNIAYAYGVSLLNAKDREKAMGFFRQELERDPNHVASLMQLTLHIIDAGNYEEALVYALRAQQADPSNFTAYYALGRIYLELNDVTKAVGTLEKAVAMEPNVPSLYFVLSRAYARAKRPADAARARAEFARLEELEKEKRKATAFAGAQETSEPATPSSPPSQ
jgi:tetratricopeptide (TPR) repeat protein